MEQLNDYEISCQKCGKKFTLKLTESQYIKNKYRKHCSRSCANSRVFSKESIEKKRAAALNNKKLNKTKYKYKNYTCKYCGKNFTVIDDRDLSSRKYCSKKESPGCECPRSSPVGARAGNARRDQVGSKPPPGGGPRPHGTGGSLTPAPPAPGGSRWSLRGLRTQPAHLHSCSPQGLR